MGNLNLNTLVPEITAVLPRLSSLDLAEMFSSGLKQISLLQQATRLTALKLRVRRVNLPEVPSVLAPMTRMAELSISSDADTTSTQLLSNEQAVVLGFVLSRLPLRMLPLPMFKFKVRTCIQWYIPHGHKFGTYWRGAPQSWHAALLRHCSAYVKFLLYSNCRYGGL
jgi:hypothetical protein